MHNLTAGSVTLRPLRPAAPGGAMGRAEGGEAVTEFERPVSAPPARSAVTPWARCALLACACALGACAGPTVVPELPQDLPATWNAASAAAAPGPLDAWWTAFV